MMNHRDRFVGRDIGVVDDRDLLLQACYLE